MRAVKLSDFLIPLCLTALVAAVFYPGMMSYDTIYALHGARSVVTNPEWPPMVSYIWRIVDDIWPNPSAMHIVQLYIYLTCTYYVLSIEEQSTKRICVWMAACLLYPSVLGTLAVIWKDVLMAGLILAGFCLAHLARLQELKSRKLALLVLGIAVLYIGTCIRHNAIAGSFILIAWIGTIFVREILQLRKWRVMACLVLSTALVLGAISFKSFFDTYSLPGLTRYQKNPMNMLSGVMVLDLAGASICSGTNGFVGISDALTLDKIRQYYDPRHCNLSIGIFNLVDNYNVVPGAWMQMFKEHPFCMLANKYLLARTVLGFGKGGVFLITQDRIEPNEWGYEASPSFIRDATFTYIRQASRQFVCKPFQLYGLTLIVFLTAVIRKRLKEHAGVLLLSGFGYFASTILLGNAGDARLSFYTVTTLFLFVAGNYRVLFRDGLPMDNNLAIIKDNNSKPCCS